MTEAVSLGELLHEEALFGLTGVRKVGVPRRHLFPSGLCLSAISLVVCAWPDPLPTGLNGDGKNVQTLWWAELDRLHSMTRAHPPLKQPVIFIKIIAMCSGKLKKRRNNNQDIIFYNIHKLDLCKKIFLNSSTSRVSTEI